RYDPFHTQPTTVRLVELSLVAPADRATAVRSGAKEGRLMADACMLTRDLGNAPPSYLTAEGIADLAVEVAAGNGLRVEVFDRRETVEVQNTDAEGRLVMADALVLATERDHPDAIVDIATLTGAALRALGPKMAALMGNNQTLVDQVIGAAQRTDERVWQLPLERRYRSQLN